MTDPMPITAHITAAPPSVEENSVGAAHPSQADLNRAHLRRELWWALGSLGFGLLILPGVIYLVGTMLLGPYGGGANGAGHVGSFYGDVFRGLAAPAMSAWSIVLGPIVVIVLMRLILIRWPIVLDNAPATESLAPSTARADKPTIRNDERREPFIGS
jgi:hypothetical protein